MNKTNETSKLGPAPQARELRDDELENVSGGGKVDPEVRNVKYTMFMPDGTP